MNDAFRDAQRALDTAAAAKQSLSAADRVRDALLAEEQIRNVDRVADLARSASESVAAMKLEQALRNADAYAAPRPNILPIPSFTPPDAEHMASAFYKRLRDWIATFEENLDADTEVGLHLVSFGQTTTFHLVSMGYWNPALISFQGVDADGRPVELIQHVSQISVLLQAVPKLREQPTRIGFEIPTEL